MKKLRFPVLCPVACGALILLGCAATAPIHTFNKVLYSSPLLSAARVCTQGVCVLPFWDERRDTSLASPTTKAMEALIRKAGHRRLKLVRYKRVVKRAEAATDSVGIMRQFATAAFQDSFFVAPVAFWKSLKVGYLLRISFRQGEFLRMFDGQRKIQAVLHARLYSVAGKRVVWHGKTTCKGTVASEEGRQKFLDAALWGLIEQLPVKPNISYIPDENEVW